MGGAIYSPSTESKHTVVSGGVFEAEKLVILLVFFRHWWSDCSRPVLRFETETDTGRYSLNKRDRDSYSRIFETETETETR